MVNDQLGHGGVTTNGSHKVTDNEPPAPTHEGMQFASGQSVEERLEALMETIRTWDWRAASVEAGSPPADQAALTIPGLAMSAADGVGEDFRPATYGTPDSQAAAENQSVVLNPMSRPEEEPPPDASSSAETQAASLVTAAAMTIDVPVQPRHEDATDAKEAVGFGSAGPVTLDPPLREDPNDVTPAVELGTAAALSTLSPRVPGDQKVPSDDATKPPESVAGPRRPSDSRRGPIGRLWSHRWAKVAVLCLAAVVVVILIIWGIRLVHNGPGSGAPSLPPPSTAARHATSHTAFVAPIDNAQLAQYEQYAAGLQKANIAATSGFISAGSTPTTAQLTPVVTAYRTALNLYDFQLHFIQWPASMQSAIQVDHGQLTALLSLLQSFSLVSSTGTSVWLSDVRDRASTTQTADNEIRHDVGLPSSSSFP